MAKLEKVVLTIGLIILFVLALLLRITKIGKIPAGFYVDEAAIAYNGYSLLQTGMDEYGKKIPVLLRSFGEYKTPTYSYLLIPIFKKWGKSVASARSLTVISGLLTIIGVIILTKIWFRKNIVAYISGLVLALMPWHLIYSRSIYEVNLALTFMVWGIVFLEMKTKKVKWNWIVGFCLFAFSIVTYNASRIVVPLIGLTWFLLNYQTIFNHRNWKWLVLASLLGIVCMWPVWQVVTTSGFWERAGINIFNSGNPWGYEGNFGIIYYKLREWVSLYVAYLNPFYLFNLGDKDGKSILVDTTLLFGWQLPFLFFGLKKLEKIDKKNAIYLISILLISPIAASFTRDPMASIRSLFIVVPFSILIGFGISEFIENAKNWGIFVTLILFLFGVGRLYLSLFKITDFYHFRDWNYGLEQISLKLKQIPTDTHIKFVGNQINYIQLAFFIADPQKYISENFNKKGDDYYISGSWPTKKQIGHIEINDLIWKEDIYKNQILIFKEYDLTSTQIAEHCLTPVFEIKGLDEKKVFIGVKTNPELKKTLGNKGCLQ